MAFEELYISGGTCRDRQDGVGGDDRLVRESDADKHITISASKTPQTTHTHTAMTLRTDSD